MFLIKVIVLVEKENICIVVKIQLSDDPSNVYGLHSNWEPFFHR